MAENVRGQGTPGLNRNKEKQQRGNQEKMDQSVEKDQMNLDQNVSSDQRSQRDSQRNSQPGLNRSGESDINSENIGNRNR